MSDAPTSYEHGGLQKGRYEAADVVEVPCPSCGGSRRTLLSTERGALAVSRCIDCGLIYTSTRARDPHEIYWGDHDKYLAEFRPVLDGLAPHHRAPNYDEELDLIERYRRGGRFLDVGCNAGMLLRTARARGWDVMGVEPSPSLSRIAREQSGLEVWNGFLSDLPASLHGTFDVVALSDVFEHIADPRSFLRQVRDLVKADGILYVKVPNAGWNLLKAALSRVLGRMPPNDLWDAHEHVVHYSDVTLAHMLKQCGFEPMRITIGRPVQIPIWHELVGAYYQHRTPWRLDWRRQSARSSFYWAAFLERALRGGRIGWCAPNLAAVARCR